MSDLIERLRNSRNWNIEIHYEAADEIERLTTQLGKANERLATLEAVSIENHQRAYEAERRLSSVRLAAETGLGSSQFTHTKAALNPEREQSGGTGGDRPDSYRAGEKPYTADGESGGIDSDRTGHNG